jgi:ABC-type multidrug transport system fused ATPase/permease subunit
VAQGQAVALVGPTGAGKTTVVNLLLRFVEPSAGRVEVGGIPLGNLDPDTWRSRIAWVPQHPYLFHGSVADNIRLARAGATDDEVVAAARAAQAHGFIEALPAGYATQIGEDGTRLSGGERQRLALARAYLKDAPVLILDEPTSHLGAASQESVLQSLARLRAGRTVILIAHHLPSAAPVDLVAVMKAGRVVDVVTGRVGAIAGAGGAP